MIFGPEDSCAKCGNPPECCSCDEKAALFASPGKIQWPDTVERPPRANHKAAEKIRQVTEISVSVSCSCGGPVVTDLRGRGIWICIGCGDRCTHNILELQLSTLYTERQKGSK